MYVCMYYISIGMQLIILTYFVWAQCCLECMYYDGAPVESERLGGGGDEERREHRHEVH